MRRQSASSSTERAVRIPRQQAELFVGNSGTTARFLTALLALGHGDVRRRRRRAHARSDRSQPLLDALRQLGVDASVVVATAVRRCGVDGRGSRRRHARGMRGRHEQPVFQRAAAGRAVHQARPPDRSRRRSRLEALHRHDCRRRCAPSARRWSNDEYPALRRARRAALSRRTTTTSSRTHRPPRISSRWRRSTGGRGARARTSDRNSVQGDLASCDVLEQMGCTVMRERKRDRGARTDRLHGIEVDMNAISDTVQTLAAIAPLRRRAGDDPRRRRTFATRRPTASARSSTSCGASASKLTSAPTA